MGKAGSIAFMLSYNYPVEETFEMATLTQVCVCVCVCVIARLLMREIVCEGARLA